MSSGGQDLRMPLTGGTKMPTDDSKGSAQRSLRKSQSMAEVGPAPSYSKLKATGPKISDMTPGVGDTNLMPKVGSMMDEKIKNDPLVRFLKEAQSLEDNKDSMPKGTKEPEKTLADPEPTSEMKSSGADGQKVLNKLFSNTSGIRKKFEQKMKK